MRTRLLVVPMLVAVLGAAACGGDDAASDADTNPTTSAAVATTTVATIADPTTTVPDGQAGVPDGPVIRLADSSLGGILTDGDGNTLYMFDADSPTASACAAQCAAVWSPFPGPASADGVDPARLGTVTRDDGTLQATYGGHPLYRYASGDDPGDTSGQGVDDAWWVLNAEGDSIRGAGDAGGGTPDPYR